MSLVEIPSYGFPPNVISSQMVTPEKRSVQQKNGHTICQNREKSSFKIRKIKVNLEMKNKEVDRNTEAKCYTREQKSLERSPRNERREGDRNGME